MTPEAARDAAIRANQWRKSSFSQGESDCVEVSPALNGWVFVRDSKSQPMPPIGFPSEHWNVVVAALRSAPQMT